MCPTRLYLFLGISLSCLVPQTLHGATFQDTAAPDSDRQMEAYYFERQTPHVDGRLEDTAWMKVPAATGFIQREPRPGAPATLETEVKVAYDREALHIAFRLHDPSPDSIIAPLSRRDVGFGSSDWATIFLDSYHDQRTAFVFSVNPRGVKRDFRVFNDAQEDYSWDAVWEVATRMDSLGWTAEFRIPLSQLRFTPENPVWGINLGRYVARREEQSYWSPWLPSAPGYVSSFGRLAGLRHLSAPRRLELQPYSVGRVTRAPGDPEDPFHSPNQLALAAGVDLRAGLISGFTLAATLNPDFGQVEADPSVVNLTAFETRFPERRPFFVEGTEIFDFGTGAGDLFYSRRIGRSPQGSVPRESAYEDTPEATTILGAIKLTGKTASGWSIGLLDALTAPEEARLITADGEQGRVPVEPLTNYGVLRVRRDLRDGGSTLGAIFTATNRRLEDARLEFLRSSAYIGGIDGRHRFGGGNYEASGYLVGSTIRGSPEAIVRTQREPERYFQRPDADHLYFDPGRTILDGIAAEVQVAKIGGGNWRWGVEALFVSPEFETDDLGFQRRADLVGQSAAVKYQSYRPGSVFRRWNLRASQDSEWTWGGERVGTTALLSSSFQFANYWGGYAQILRRFSALSTSQLRGGPALRVPGYYRPVVSLHTDRRNAVRGRLFLNYMREGQTGGRFLDVSPTVEARPVPQMELSIGPSLEWRVNPWQYVARVGRADDPQYLFGRLRQTEFSVEARVNYTFTPTLSLQFFAEPFISAGSYDHFLTVDDPRAASFRDRFRPFAGGEIQFDPVADRYRVDLDSNGTPDDSFRDPAFNLKRLNANLLLRWEYRPGSTLYLVWQGAGRDTTREGTLRIWEDTRDLFRTPGRNVLLLKVSHWLSL